LPTSPEPLADIQDIVSGVVAGVAKLLPSGHPSLKHLQEILPDSLALFGEDAFTRNSKTAWEAHHPLSALDKQGIVHCGVTAAAAAFTPIPNNAEAQRHGITQLKDTLAKKEAPSAALAAHDATLAAFAQRAFRGQEREYATGHVAACTGRAGKALDNLMEFAAHHSKLPVRNGFERAAVGLGAIGLAGVALHYAFTPEMVADPQNPEQVIPQAKPWYKILLPALFAAGISILGYNVGIKGQRTEHAVADMIKPLTQTATTWSSRATESREAAKVIPLQRR
jgi:hypothetical protein